MKNIDLLIFDLDGTLVDSKRDLAVAVNYALEQTGIPTVPELLIYQRIGNGTRRLVADILGEKYQDKVDSTLSVFLNYYRRNLLVHTILYPGIKEVLDHFSTKKKAVITNKGKEFSEAILTGLGVRQYFNLLLGREDVTKPKPDNEPILKVLDIIQIRPEHSVIIGDGVTDIISARHTGVLSCAVGYGLGTKDELLAENPDYFIDTITELKNLFI